jgi:hypothetical protein
MSGNRKIAMMVLLAIMASVQTYRGEPIASALYFCMITLLAISGEKK